MSDEHQNKNIEQLAQETAASGEPMAASDAEVNDSPPPGPAAKPAVAAPVTTPPVADPGRGSPVLAGLALLLVLVVGGVLAWSVLEQQRIQTGVAERLQALESDAGREQDDLDELGRRLQDQLTDAVGQLRAGSAELDGRVARLSGQLDEMQAQLADQRAELARYSANDRDAWLLAEAQYLLRLANQRLVMAGDAVAARALLVSADKILLELDDVSLHGARAAVAADLAALRAVPGIDVQGIYLRLAALAEQAGKLVIFQLPERESLPAPAPADTWRARLRQGFDGALAKLSNYIIIRRRDVPMQALMDPQWEGLVRQNLRMLLEQAQVALLSGNQLLYRESLERARHWVGEFLDSDEAAARAISREIDQLVDMEVGTSLPDISRSVEALDEVMKQRLQQGGTE